MVFGGGDIRKLFTQNKSDNDSLFEDDTDQDWNYVTKKSEVCDEEPPDEVVVSLENPQDTPK